MYCKLFAKVNAVILPPIKASTRDDNGRRRTKAQMRRAQSIIDRVRGMD